MMNKKCFFCNKDEGIRILTVKEKETGEKHPVCNKCFAKWRHLSKGLLYKGKRYFLR